VQLLLGPGVERVRVGRVHGWIHGGVAFVKERARSARCRQEIVNEEEMARSPRLSSRTGSQNLVVGGLDDETKAHNQLNSTNHVGMADTRLAAETNNGPSLIPSFQISTRIDP
jgi:hypothetical protein